jgi:arabinofuranosyltransferase
VLGLAAAPLVAWTAFALFYYGSLWPNPALAKLDVGLGAGELARQGLVYLAAHRGDPVLAVVLLAGIGVALARPATRGLGVGLLVMLLYLVRIGGDFMLGRMLGGAFLVAAVLVVRGLAAWPARVVWAVAATALVAAILLPRTPLNTPASLDDQTVRDRLADERAYYFQATSLWVRLRTPADQFPAHEWTRRGRAAANRDDRVVGAQNLGFFGHAAGTDKILVDLYAIADPLLARIPVRSVPDDWRPGHLKRSPPAGYARSLRSGENELRDPTLRALYADVRLATAAPLLAPGRVGAVWRLTF